MSKQSGTDPAAPAGTAMAIAGGGQDPVVVAPRKATGQLPPRWEADTRDRVRSAVRRFARPLADLIDRDANEGDTRLLVTDFLCEALGYDKYEDLTTEYQVRGEFADYGVRIDKQLVAFVEVKRAATKLGAKHLRQVEMYSVNEGVEWMILTNGQVWQSNSLLTRASPATLASGAPRSREVVKRPPLRDVVTVPCEC
jgi:Type I restriction enzyme R protein N terminus (HSDR_N)